MTFVRTLGLGYRIQMLKEAIKKSIELVSLEHSSQILFCFPSSLPLLSQGRGERLIIILVA